MALPTPVENPPHNMDPEDFETMELAMEGIDAEGSDGLGNVDDQGIEMTPNEDDGALSDDEVLAIVENEITQGSGYFGGELSHQREKAMEYYLCMPRGDEMPGRSSVISSDVSDVVEWILPQIIRAFTTNDDLIEFTAINEDDEEQAQMEADYVAHVLRSQDDYYEFLYTYVKDSLLQKTGVSKASWVEENKRVTETYEGLNDMELAQVLEPDQESEVEPREYSARTETMEGPEGPQEMQVHDLKLRRTHTRGRVKLEAVAPEQFIISRDATSINPTKARFCAHKDFMYASDLVEEGLDRDFVDTLPGYSFDDTGERETRRFLEDEQDYYDDAFNKATRKIYVYECYIRLDRDGDGIAELLKVRVAGPDSYVLIDIEEMDASPFSAVTPFLLTHKFFGLSLYDKIKQLQDQKTVVWRQILDNLYLQNNSRNVVIEGQVNLDDLLTSRPGGIIRALSPGAVMPMPVAPVGAEGYQMLEYLDKVRSDRSGASPEGASQAFMVGGDTAHGIERLLSQKEELQGLIIRTMAETGIKLIYRQIREILMKHQSQAEKVKLRGKWAEINPREWSQRYGVRARVVLGSGDKMRLQQEAAAIMEKQAELVATGGAGIVVSQKNVYNALCDYTRYSDVGSYDRYWMDPESEEAQQALQKREQDAEEQKQLQMAGAAQGERMAAIEARSRAEQAQLRAQVDGLKAQLTAAETRSDQQFNMLKMYEELQFKYTELETKESVDIPGKGV